jgi:hypothetical protein
MDSIVSIDVTIAACVRVHDPQESADLLLVCVLDSLGCDEPKNVIALAYQVFRPVPDQSQVARSFIVLRADFSWPYREQIATPSSR